MAFGSFQGSTSATFKPLTTMSDINVTPMVDVMLVLLVIFIIAAPMMTHAIRLELPDAQSAAVSATSETIELSIDVDGVLFWNQQRVAMPQLAERLSTVAQRQPQPELQLRADKATRYEIIAQVMAAAQAQGLNKIGFVTERKSQ